MKYSNVSNRPISCDITLAIAAPDTPKAGNPICPDMSK